jgi:hypothetical protein
MLVETADSTGLMNSSEARRLGVTCQARASPMETFSIRSSGPNSSMSW